MNAKLQHGLELLAEGIGEICNGGPTHPSFSYPVADYRAHRFLFDRSLFLADLLASEGGAR